MDTLRSSSPSRSGSPSAAWSACCGRAPARRTPPGMVDQAEVMQGLDRLSDQMHDLDRERASWQGQFHQHVSDLRRETHALSTALRKPQVRGRWGELHLRRAVELAGLVDRCDFSEQVRLRRRRPAARPRRPPRRRPPGRRRRQGAARRLPRRHVAPTTRTSGRRHLARHARQLRQHVDELSSKAYWRSLHETPEFVVLFVPAESFLAAALETDPQLIEYAATRQVVLATPDHPDRAAPHRRPRLEPRGARRPGPRDPPPRPRAPRPARQPQRPPRPGRPLAERRRRPLQPGGRLAGVAGARRRAAVQELSVTDDELPAPRQVETTTRSLARSPPTCAGRRPATRAPRPTGGGENTVAREPHAHALGGRPGARPPGRGARSRARAHRRGDRPGSWSAGSASSSTCASSRCASPSRWPCAPPTSSPSACCRR